MKVQYFQQTDTLYIEFKPGTAHETRELDENTLLELDRDGNVLAMTVEHAAQRTGIPQFSFEQVAAA